MADTGDEGDEGRDVDGTARGEIELRAFRRGDQAPARTLIEAGLGERWGRLDRHANPDLIDIGDRFRDGRFLCAWRDGALVGTGGIRPEGEGRWRIERVSVAAHCRGRRIGQQILTGLVDWARRHGARRVVLETTTSWTDATAFYRRCGFVEVASCGGDTHMERTRF